ncbi:dihydroorotase family protein [Plantactinospora sp. KBS50]|uniref:dihydroorotase n=1 Tax=Plantactinospora sp. KBS50 TaxID=2024580 RepID=UPI0012FE61F9|nr:amidohydrolase family protein [Plantactinospora sp. KBS50]
MLPGIIDAHNHPYYADDIEAFSVAAAAGGVTTLIPFAGRQWHGAGPSSLTETVAEFVANGQARSCLDFGAHVIVSPGDDMATAVPELIGQGIASFKAFTAFPGNRMLDDGQIFDLMYLLGRSGALAMVHCENGHAAVALERRLREAGRVGAGDYGRSRPSLAESEAVYRALSLAELAGCDAYIVHVSAAESLDVIRGFRDRPGPARYAETCTHYLLLTEEDQQRLGGLAKISPPIRGAADRAAIWDAVRDGTIDVVASDASGQTRAGKKPQETNFFEVPFGLPGVEHMLPLVVHGGLYEHAVGLTTLARVFCERPADIFGLGHRKGRLIPGHDGDLVVYDPFPAWTVGQQPLHGNSDYSVFDGRQVFGRPVLTVQRGRTVLHDGAVVAEPGQGEFLPAGPAAGEVAR